MTCSHDARRSWSQALWLLHRLRLMSAGEVVRRVRDRARFELWKRRAEWPPGRLVRRAQASMYRLPDRQELEGAEAAVERAALLLDGRLNALGQTFLLEEVDWLLDPQSGIRSPLSFGPLIDYRNAARVGNVRNVWELNRHQHLTLAALAYALSGEERFARFVGRQLDSWLAQDPFPMGVNWSSPLELGLRLISWVWIARLLKGSDEREKLFGNGGRLWPAVYRHQWMIAKLHSSGSSANNHVIGEMAGLLTATGEWPLFAESGRWEQLARRTLEREIVRQYYPSGVNREQAFAYHLFATELLQLAELEGARTGRPLSEGYRASLRRAVEAAVGQAGPGDVLPAYGDGDDGMAIGLPGGGPFVLERLAAVAAVRLGTSAVPALSPDARLASDVLLSGVPAAADAPRLGSPAEAARVSAPPRTRAFTDAGIFVMTSGEDGDAVSCLADAGALGYLSIAAHGHADALSFTLAAGEEPMVVDAGTYTYHHDLEARAYFRGTRAHNTVTVDGLDQSVPAGPFLWARKAQVTVHEWHPTPHGGLLKASHDGYERLRCPVTHRRTLALERGVLTIEDELLGAGVHEVEWRLHLAPSCRARLQTGTCAVESEAHGFSLELDESLQWRLLVADKDGGWYSPSFNVREQTVTVVGTARLAMPARLRHVLEVEK